VTREARRVLDQILDGLSEDLRAVFLLYELEGQTMAEIASILGTPMGTVASRLRRAREEFQTAARRFQSETRSRT
jgi:RNA polymerase sigma-70 factor (ECF subfamily)